MSEEMKQLHGRFHSEIAQGLRCRHERRWEDNCLQCGRPDGVRFGMELLRLSDELAALKVSREEAGKREAAQEEDFIARIEQLEGDVAAIEVDNEQLAQYLTERNREVVTLKAELAAAKDVERKSCIEAIETVRNRLRAYGENDSREGAFDAALDALRERRTP